MINKINDVISSFLSNGMGWKKIKLDFIRSLIASRLMFTVVVQYIYSYFIVFAFVILVYDDKDNNEY